jgi:hypothetical protein
MMSLDERLERAGAAYRGALEAMADPRFRASGAASTFEVVGGRVAGRWVRPAGWAAVAAVVVGLLVVIGVRHDRNSTTPTGVSAPTQTTVQAVPSATPVPTTTPVPTAVTTTLEPAQLPTTSVPPSDTGDLLDIKIAPFVFDVLPPCEICPSIASTPDGTVITYDRLANTIGIGQQGATPPRTIDLRDPVIPSTAHLAAIGPDDVAYLVVQAHGNGPIADVVAVALDGDKAGSVVARRDNSVDLSVDADLVPTRTGLVSVGCCGPETVRPNPSAAPVMTWVDHNGDDTADVERPEVSIEVTAHGFDLIRTDPDGTTVRWTAPPPGAAGLRGMPITATLADGSVLASWFDWANGIEQMVRFKPSGTIERIRVPPDTAITALDTFGGALIYGGQRYQHWQLPTFTAPIEDLALITALAGPEPLASADDAIARITKALAQPDGCETPPIAQAVKRAGTDPLTVTIEYRFSCDDSGAGTNIDLTIQSEPTGTWTITTATERSLCRRGGDDQACT